MKVLHLMVSGGTGGIETLLNNYAHGSKLENHFAFLWETGPIVEDMNQNGIPVLVLNVRKDGMPRTLQKITACCRQEKFDAVVSHHSAPFLKVSLLWIKLCLPNVRIYAYAHANAYDICNGAKRKGLCIRKWVHKTVFRYSDGVIAISNSVKQSLTEYLQIPEKKIRVIYNGTPVEENLPLRTQHNRLELIYVGRLIREKGVQNIFCALENLQGEKAYTLTIVGDGTYRSALESMIAGTEMEKRIRFLGNRRDVPELLRRADYFIHFPEWEEGFGLTVVEAMAAGCICVCNRKGAIPEIITSGVDGWLSSDNTPEALTDILQIAFSDTNRHKISENAMHRAGDFSIERYCQCMDAYLLEK